jgi:hypothetical protein
MAGKLYVGDVGTVIIVDCEDDLTEAVNTQLLITKPNGNTDVWVAETYAINGSRQYLRYFVVDGDFDQDGEFTLQAYAEIPEEGSRTWKGRGEVAKFMIYA